MSAIPRGVTVSIAPVFNFDKLPLDEATKVIEDRVVTACEAKGVKLSREGNHTNASYLSVEGYDKMKKEHRLFDVKRIQKAFAGIEEMFKRASKFETSGIKHYVEYYQDEYIANADLSVALLLKGYEARFGKRTEEMSHRADFKVILLKRKEVFYKMNPQYAPRAPIRKKRKRANRE